MGTARVNEDTAPDLFMYSDKYNPGTFYYLFERFSPQGTPIYSQKHKIKLPFDQDTQRKSVILENDQHEIWGFWASDKRVYRSRFNKQTRSFEELKTIEVQGLPSAIGYFGVLQLAPSEYVFLFTVADTTKSPKYPVPNPANRHEFERYSQDGFWQQQLPKSGIYGAFFSRTDPERLVVKPLTSLTQTYYFLESYTCYTFNNQSYILAGTTLGNIHVYQVDQKKKSLTEVGYLKDPNGQTLRNPAIHGFLASVEVAEHPGLIVSSEGGIFFYKQKKGHTLSFEKPVSLLQTKPDLYGGSLVVPDLADWDGDGDIDLVFGNSLGHIQWFENRGTNTNPKFGTPVTLKAGGYPIHIQPGYNQNIQGPGEARWGYACPTVFDWNNDGLTDILTGDSRSKFNLYINEGKQNQPRLAPEHPLFLDGLDLYGTWRVKPGVGKLGGRNAYIILDSDDEFHLYWQLDSYNVTDGGKLMIGDSIPIRANFRRGGETGRSKITIVDWDQDGIKDLLVGTPRYSTIPEPKKGMPYRLPNNGAAVLFLRNAGTETRPVYEYPVAIRFKGKRINLGQHACSPTAGFIGPGHSLNLLVGDETGRFYFYKREDLQWSPPTE
ncbi:hypothetical protein GCM10027347_61800 [Larkinella harenae]